MNYGIKAMGATTGSGGTHFRVLTWRVIGHHGDYGEIVEKAADTEYFHLLRWDVFRGRISPVPPAELLPLMSDDWRVPQPFITYTEPLP